MLISGEHVNLSPYFNQAVLEGKEDILLDSLDATAEKCSHNGMDGLPSLTRTLAAIADVLGTTKSIIFSQIKTELNKKIFIQVNVC